MIDDPSYQSLRELSWRRKLTSAEEAELRTRLLAHPEAEAEWEAKAALNEALNQLPAPALASNFTAGVLETVRFEEAAAARRLTSRRGAWWWLRGWWPKTALAMLLLGGVLFTYQRERQLVQRKQIAKSVLTVAGVPSLPGPEVLENFNAVYSLNRTPPDEDLLAVLASQ